MPANVFADSSRSIIGAFGRLIRVPTANLLELGNFTGDPRARDVEVIALGGSDEPRQFPADHVLDARVSTNVAQAPSIKLIAPAPPRPNSKLRFSWRSEIDRSGGFSAPYAFIDAPVSALSLPHEWRRSKPKPALRMTAGFMDASARHWTEPWIRRGRLRRPAAARRRLAPPASAYQIPNRCCRDTRASGGNQR